MRKIDFDSILPTEESNQLENAKKELPYGLLIEYADAINKKYNNKLTAYVTESTQIVSVLNNDNYKENLVFALSIEAAIGSGYLYRLLEVEQIRNTVFPVRVKVFRDHTSVLGTYKDYDSFYENIVSFLGSGIVKGIITNLLGMVDLYNESRNETYDFEETV